VAAAWERGDPAFGMRARVSLLRLVAIGRGSIGASR
jgi:hypothetical protein